MAWIMSLNKYRVSENVMRYSSEYLLSAERGFFSLKCFRGDYPQSCIVEDFNYER